MRSSAVRQMLAGWAAVVFLLVLTAMAGAQPSGPPGQMGPGQMPPGGRGMMPPPGMGPGGGPGWQGAIMRLDLTDQQRSDIMALFDGQRESERSRREATRKTQQALATAVFASSPDATASAYLVQQLADQQRLTLEADVALQQRVAALLTEEQRAQLLKLLSQGPPRGGAPPER